jgi:glycosyltransferase involved in cell wall biosynthesis
VKIVQVNFAVDADIHSAEAVLDRYSTLTGWSNALAAAGADVLTVQRFPHVATVTRNRIDYIFGTYRRLIRGIVAFQPDLVHVNGLMFSLQTWLLRRALPKTTAIVVQDHASGDPGSRRAEARLRHVVRRRLMRAADGFLFTSAVQAEPWRRVHLIAPDQPVYDVPEASTTLGPIPRDRARAATGVRGSPAVLWVGRLNRNKDPLTVLDGFERSLARLPEATLTLVSGEGDLLPAVRDHVAAAPMLRGCVQIVGRVPHDRIASFYSAADLFAIGSHHEGSGYATIEAIACGVAPVVTDIPAFRALTAEGTIGALWPTGDPAACARALVEVASRDLASERIRTTSHFDRALSWRAVGERAMAIYRDVVQKKRGGPESAPAGRLA